MGLTKVMQDYSIVLISLAGLGFVGPFFRFGPYYESYAKKGQSDLMQLYLIIVHAGMLLVVVLSYLFEDTIKGYFGVRSPLFSVFYYWTLVYAYLFLLFGVFEMYLFSKGEAVFQSFTREIIVRIIIFLLLMAVLLGLQVQYFITLFSIHYLIPLLLLIWYAWRKYPFALGVPWSKISKRLLPHMSRMAGIGIMQTIIYAGVPVVDTLVVGGMVGLEGVATYLLMNYISTLVYVPVRATSSVLGAKVSSYWKENEIDKIQVVYQRSSMSYLIFAVFMVSLILFNMDLFQRLIGKNITLSLSVVLPLVLAKIFELSTGLSNLIIGYSKKWKIESAISIGNVLIAIPLNIYMVGRYGITGAAISTLILAFLTFSTRILVLYKIYRLFPFRFRTLGFLLFGATLFILFYMLCGTASGILVKMVLSAIYAVFFMVVIVWFRFSEDINIVFENLVKRFGKYRRP